MNVITKTVSLPDGRTISIETGKLAKQTDGSVMLRMGNTMLLATVCAAKDAVPGTDFMPLQVDYKEQYAAAVEDVIAHYDERVKLALELQKMVLNEYTIEGTGKKLDVFLNSIK